MLTELMLSVQKKDLRIKKLKIALTDENKVKIKYQDTNRNNTWQVK